MEKTQFMTKAGNLSRDVETSILSAHKKYFQRNSESLRSLNGAESMLYDAVIRYFKALPGRHEKFTKQGFTTDVYWDHPAPDPVS